VKREKVKIARNIKKNSGFGRFKSSKKHKQTKMQPGLQGGSGSGRRNLPPVDYKESRTNSKRPGEQVVNHVQPPKRRPVEQIKVNHIQPAKTRPPIPTSNKFELLTNSTDKMEVETEQDESNNNKHFRPILTAKPRDKSTPKKAKPIVLWNTTHEDLKKMSDELNFKGQFQKMKSKNAYQLFPSSKEEKKLVREHLDDKAAEYHTYTEVEDRHSIFILKNFEMVQTAELVKILQAANIPAKFATLISKNVNNPVYRVSFEKNSVDINTLTTTHRYVDRLKVTWEKLAKTKQRPTICHNCQAWGHSANNCKRPYRCFKCIEPHARGECKRTAEDAFDESKPPQCVNCHENHVTSYFECPAYVSYVARTKKRSSGQQVSSPRAFTSTPAPKNSSWAAAFQTNADGFPPLGASTASTSQAASRVNAWGKSQPVSAKQPTFQFHSTQNDSNDFTQFAQLQSGFNAIEGFGEAMQIVSNFQMHLRNFAGNPLALAGEILKFLHQLPCT
jgi:hypothetical protein